MEVVDGWVGGGCYGHCWSVKRWECARVGRGVVSGYGDFIAGTGRELDYEGRMEVAGLVIGTECGVEGGPEIVGRIWA